MSLFTFSYGDVSSFNVVLTTTSVTTVLSVGANDEEAVIKNIRAGLASGASQTTVRFEKFDGTTSYPVVNWITLEADEVYLDNEEIHLDKGWSLRATRGAGSNVSITGVYVQATKR